MSSVFKTEEHFSIYRQNQIWLRPQPRWQPDNVDFVVFVCYDWLIQRFLRIFRMSLLDKLAVAHLIQQA